MMPIGPAPVMSTSSPTMLNASAVCVALPNGSRIDAMSSVIESASLNVLTAGIARYSANAPGRFTPHADSVADTGGGARRDSYGSIRT